MLEFHPLANLFPLIEGRDFDELVADVRANGLQQPIVMFEDKILDGRNRYRAAIEAGVNVEAVDYQGDHPLAFVISSNLMRRHLRDSQRALVAARLATLHQGRPSAGQIAAHALTQSEAAQLLSVSVRSVHRARVILEKAAAPLLSLVETGKVSLLAADRLAALSEREQTEAANQGARRVVSLAHRAKGGGTRGRSEFAELWRHVDAICDALEVGKLAEAGAATHKLSLAIGALATKRRAA